MRPKSGLASGRRYEQQITVGTLCFATFLATGSGIGIAPFLLEIARDLHTDLAAVGNLVGILSLSWGTASVVAATASDRLGRKPIMIAGLLLLIASPLGLALSDSYGMAAVCRFLGGLGGGAFMGTTYAAVSDLVQPSQRGRALGWIITGQSFSLVLGVPLLTFLGSLVGWRGALISHGSVMLIAVLVVWLVVPSVARQRLERPLPARAVARLLGPRVIALLAASTTERLCYAALGVFLPTYLLTTYGISQGELAIGLALVALGNLGGNVLGGQIADRVPSRPLLFAAAMLSTAAIALPVFLWHPGVAISVVLGFVYTLLNAFGRPALLAALSEVSGEARGTVMGLNITFSSFGWLGATGLGGTLIATAGFEGLGLFTAAIGLAGAALAVASWLIASPPTRA